MTYAGDRRCNDADSHIMELPGWLASYMAAELRHGLGQMGADQVAEIERQIASGVQPDVLEPTSLLLRKGWSAHGAFESGERSQVLDAMGFEKQLVFPTFALGQVFGSQEPDVFFEAIDALNRGMTAFCADDDRLLPVGFVSLRDPARALVSLERALDQGVRAVWMPSAPAGGISPAHTVHDPFWTLLESSGVPFVNHIGGGRETLPLSWHDNGRPLPTDFLGGGENLRAKDIPSIHHSVETFLTCLILDGVLQRHPRLRGGVIELGAMWVPGFVRNLDFAVAEFGKKEPLLGELEMAPSEFVHRQLKFTPFKGEDSGWLIEHEGDDLFMFSTDFPHPEGGRDPMTSFETSLDQHAIGEAARDRFYATNFDELIGDAVPASL